MGVDFLRLKAKPFLKGIDQGRVDIARRSLFTRDVVEPDERIIARCTGPGALDEGANVLLRTDGEGLVVVDDLAIRAVVLKPRASVVDRITAIGGYAQGRVLKSFPTLDLLELSIT